MFKAFGGKGQIVMWEFENEMAFGKYKTCPLRYVLAMILLFCFVKYSSAQSPVSINDSVDQHIFINDEIEFLEDPDGQYTFENVRSREFNRFFSIGRSGTPQNDNLKSAYWFRVRIRHNSKSAKNWVLEFFDQTIDSLTAYIPSGGKYEVKQLGDSYRFEGRTYSHKNFQINLANNASNESIYYFRVWSHQTADVIIVLRSVNRFIQYALDEYFLFGIFYGMILIFSFYNLMMFLAIRQMQYLYYVLYNLSVGLFQMCIDGVLPISIYGPVCPNGISMLMALHFSVSVCLRCSLPEVFFIPAETRLFWTGCCFAQSCCGLFSF